MHQKAKDSISQLEDLLEKLFDSAVNCPPYALSVSINENMNKNEDQVFHRRIKKLGSLVTFINITCLSLLLQVKCADVIAMEERRKELALNRGTYRSPARERVQNAVRQEMPPRAERVEEIARRPLRRATTKSKFFKSINRICYFC